MQKSRQHSPTRGPLHIKRRSFQAGSSDEETILPNQLFRSSKEPISRQKGMATMKAIRVHNFGDSKELKYEINVPRPKPDDNQVLVQVKAVGVNPIDPYVRTGGFGPQPFPYIPGMDFAGIVKAVGSKVTAVKPGDRVYGSTTDGMNNAYAEYIAVKESFVHPLPESLNYSQGAAIPVPYFTAYRALFHLAKAQPGETLLVHGASGGVGLAAVQLAHGMGLRVIGTAGTTAGAELVKNAGAEQVFNHREEGYLNKIKEALGEGGANIVLENVANKNLRKDLEVVGAGGRIALIGGLGEVAIDPLDLLMREIVIIGVIFFRMSGEQLLETRNAIQTGIEAGWICPKIWQELPLEKASEAHDLLASGSGARGKIILKLD